MLRCCAAICVATLAACASPGGYIVLLDGEDGEGAGAITVSNEQGERTLDSPGKSLGLGEDVDEAPKEVDAAEIEDRFGQAISAQPEKPRRFLLYFEFGSTELTAESKELIPEIIEELNRRAAPDIGIIGHTDTAGDAETNAALALERANAIRDVVIFAGARPQLIEVTSHGEERLARLY